MFRNIVDALTKNPLLEGAYGRMDEINRITQEMFILSMRVLVDRKNSPREVQMKDKMVNSIVEDIRKKVFEYLSVTTSPNIHGGLVLISLVIDYERIGDYAKDIALMRQEFDFDGDFDPGLKDRMERMEDLISLMFLESHKAMEEAKGKYPTTVTHLEEQLKVEYEGLKRYIASNDLDQPEVLTALVSARIMKRIAAHHDNIASSSVRPFPKLGFKPGSSQWRED